MAEVKGALKVLQEAITPAQRDKIKRLASFMLNQGHLEGGDRKYLLDYLKNEGANPAWKDMFPGSQLLLNNAPVEPFQVKAPQPGETWYRGGQSSLKLVDDGPVFLTRDPEGAAWYAAEKGDNGLGAVGEYEVNPQNPARLRDMYRMRLEHQDPALEDKFLQGDPYNFFDWSYQPEFRDIMRANKYDASLGSDALGRGEIDTVAPITKDVIVPRARSLVRYSEPSGKEAQYASPFKGSENYYQIGTTKPFKRKAVGGLVQYAESK